MKHILSIIILLTVLPSGCIHFDRSAFQTVDSVNLEKFMGDWYVLANIPTSIEEGAVNAIESYAMREDGDIDITFKFYEDSVDGELQIYKPKGFIEDTKTNAEWKVQFLWPFKLAYLIIGLSDDHGYTIIAGPNHDYVWVMARSPALSDGVWEEINANLRRQGYDLSRVQRVPQIWPKIPAIEAPALGSTDNPKAVQP
ncbi:MAG: lipocalin family protein [Deltaproteobacteria bacterium]|nr:lipocalin family protein [Deltaproteobacteria bacterium]MBT6435536.1 lipocalin family protein [Deltaproteobacteria bacterium]